MLFQDKSVSALFDGEIYESIKSTMVRYGMDKKMAEGVLVGLSGGADSVMLLLFCLEYRRKEALDFNIAACHVNHLIRGDEAYRDLEFSTGLARELGVELIPVTVDVPAYARENKLGIEEAARNVRYNAFNEILSGRNDLSCIALAHNASDNLETVIFNMMRGAGLAGACGIVPTRDNIIRPLIRISKAVILSLLDSHGVKYVTDSTNSETDYSRNYIRHEIAPRLLQLNSEPENAINRLTESLLEDNIYLSDRSNEILLSIKDKNSFDIKLLRELEYPILTRVLSLLITEYTSEKPSMQLITDIVGCLRSDNFSYSVGKGYSLICELGKLRVECNADNAPDGNVYLLKLGENIIPGYDATVVIDSKKQNISPNVYNFSIHVDCPSDIINDGLCLRFKRDGDAYKYGGITHKLKKVFNDRSIPPSVRNRIPVICDSQGILWVPGLPLRDGVKKDKIDTVRITIFYSTDNNKNRRIYTANTQ